MSKQAENRKLVEDKAMNYLGKAVEEYNIFIKELNAKTNLCLVPRINSIGKPDITIEWYKDKPEKGILMGKEAYNKSIVDKKSSYLDKVKEKCSKLGIILIVRIDPLNGAVIMPQLTDWKMQEIKDGISAGA